MTKKALLAHLESVANTTLPDRFYGLKENELKDLVTYADNIVAFQSAGLDKLFKSISLTMKYIPNFVLVSLTKRFLEPPLAARVTQKLTMKQVTAVGNDLTADYLAEVCLYQDNQLSADIFAALKPRHAEDILSLLCEQHPTKILDLYPKLTGTQQRWVLKTLSPQSVSKADLVSASRKEVFQQICQGRKGG